MRSANYTSVICLPNNLYERAENNIYKGLPFPGHLSRLDSFDSLLLLDVVVETVGPLADAANVQREVLALFRSRAGY